MPATLGETIRNNRICNAYSKAEFAEKLGIDYSTLYKWETDQMKPSMRNRRKIAELLKINVKELL